MALESGISRMGVGAVRGRRLSEADQPELAQGWDLRRLPTKTAAAMNEGLRLPLGNVDLRVRRLDEDRFQVSWLDVLLGELVEVEASTSELAQWERDGGLPASLTERRENLGDRIAALRARHEGLTQRREQIRREHPGG